MIETSLKSATEEEPLFPHVNLLLQNDNLLFFKDFIYLFLERGKRREKERERNIDV